MPWTRLPIAPSHSRTASRSASSRWGFDIGIPSDAIGQFGRVTSFDVGVEQRDMARCLRRRDKRCRQAVARQRHDIVYRQIESLTALGEVLVDVAAEIR